MPTGTRKERRLNTMAKSRVGMRSTMPVPAEIIVYSLMEWEDLEKKDTKFARMLKSEAIWTFSKQV